MPARPRDVPNAGPGRVGWDRTIGHMANGYTMG